MRPFCRRCCLLSERGEASFWGAFFGSFLGETRNEHENLGVPLRKTGINHFLILGKFLLLTNDSGQFRSRVIVDKFIERDTHESWHQKILVPTIHPKLNPPYVHCTTCMLPYIFHVFMWPFYLVATFFVY